jgi:hypothetical protein
MKLEANKYYRTRDGRKAYVAAIALEEIGTSYPVVGWIKTGFFTWEIDGCAGCGKEYDLIAEWTDEPEKKDAGAQYLYAYHSYIRTNPDGSNFCGGGVSLREDAPNEFTDKRFFIGRIRLEPME